MKNLLFLFLLLLLPIKASADESGTCGENLTWTYESATQTLTILGTGAMYNYSYYGNRPWFHHDSEIKRIIINDGVTTIGYYAFKNCDNLTSIDIPNSVTSIGLYAFYECSALTSIDIPNGVTSIGLYAFYECSALTSIDIPNSVTSIGEGAFSGCSSLTSIEIPNGITIIENNAFDGCSSLTSIEIPNGVKIIESNAFYGCSSLTSIEIPNSVTNIGSSAFSGCSALTSIEIPNGVTRIEKSVFSGCSSLTSIEIPNGVTSIREHAFSGCSALTSIVIPNSVTSIEDYAFKYCNAQIYVMCKNINFPNKGIFESDDVYGFSYLNSISHDTNYWNSFTPFDVPSVNIGPNGIYLKGITLQNYDDEIISFNWNDTGNDYTELHPNTSYQLLYTMHTAKGGQIQGYFECKTPELILKSQNPKVINSGEVIVAATTNLFDDAPNAGFEWRKIDAPKEIPSKSAEAPVYDGMIEGIVKNVDVNSYYKVRPYYKASDGTSYYGDWIGFDPSDFSYFEPTVKTYENVEINEGVAKLVGYALKGSDEITEQGFEYWNTEGSDHLTILASGQRMEAKLQNLNGGTTYGYRAYVKTDKGITYGNEYTFDMPGFNHVEEIIPQPVLSKTRMGVYTINGQKIADTLLTAGSLPRGIYIVDGRKMVIK